MMGYVNSEDILHEVCAPSGDGLQNTVPSPQQQCALQRLLDIEDPDMKQEIITQNLRRVVNIARRYSNYGVAHIDLIREGIQGLIHALENFEREGGFRFESYAVQCVRRSIERVIVNRSNPLSVRLVV